MRIFNYLLAASALNHSCALRLYDDDSAHNDYTPLSKCYEENLPDENDKCFMRSQKWDGPVSK